MKIAIIGSGIAGMSAAYYLNKKHDITLFEKDDRLGGHTATKDITLDGKSYRIDTGFIVFNDRTYPNFIALMNELNVPFSETPMGFSVSCKQTGLEYAGKNLNTIFAQRKNLLSPSFYTLLFDIMRFNKQAQKDYQEKTIPQGQTLGEYLDKNKYSETFSHNYLVPMGAAIWSASFDTMRNFPIEFFIRFFFNHGLLDITNRPKWRVIDGGSNSYIPALTKSYSDKIHLSSKIKTVIRTDKGAELHMQDGEIQHFDQVVFACHSDQALALLHDATPLESELLNALPYEENSVVMHYDTSLLPKKRLTWSSWNYNLHEKIADKGQGETQSKLPVLTYNMNILQHIKSDYTFCVTLNADDDIDPSKILGKYRYSHPQFSLKGIAAQERWQEINGTQNTWFCGAYWANGFHEDGVSTALRVAKAIG